MKKLIITLIAVAMILAMAAPVSAVTLGKWDFDAGASHAQQTGEDMIRESTEELPEPTDVTWMDWLHRWQEWFVHQKQ